MSETTQNSSSLWPAYCGTALLVGLLFFCVTGWSAWLEIYLLSGGLPRPSDALRLVAGAFSVGFLPAAVLALAAQRIRGRISDSWLQQLLFWLPTVAGFLIAFGTTLADPGASFGLLHLGLGGAAIGLYLGWLRFGRGRLQMPYWLFAVGLAWLLAGVALSQMLQNLHGNLPSIAHASPLVIGLGCPVLFLMHACIRQLWDMPSQARFRVALTVAFFVLSMVALTGIWQLQTLFIGMYLPVKAFVATSVLIALWLIFEPVIARGASRFRALTWLAGLIALAGIGATAWMATQPIGERFGSFPVRSVVGLSAQVISTPDDSDGDGFYAEGAGGNDCDDADASRHPVAHDPAKNCWAGNSEVEPPHQPTANREVPPTRAEHVVLIVVDALRADLLTDPAAAEYTPHLRRLARRSLTFTRAYPPGNATRLSVLPTLSDVSAINALESFTRGVPAPPEELLARTSVLSLANDEFCTAFWSYSTLAKGWLVDHAGVDLDLARAVPDRTDTGHSAPFVRDDVRDMLDTCDGRRSMLALYIDDPHRDYAKRGYSCRDGSAGGRRCYLEEVSVVDDMIGELVELLEQRQIFDRTLFVVTSDHGEAFAEHGHTQHATSAYEEQIHVPLVVHAPGTHSPGDTPRHIDRPVSLLGFKATVAHATGLELDHQPRYPSWLAIADTPQLAPPPVVHNWMGLYKRGWTSPSSAILVGNHKLIYDWKSTRLQVYDLDADPAELHNLAAEEPELARELLEQFQRQHVRLLTHQPK